MQKENQFITLGPFIKSCDMARKYSLSEDFIVKLCFYDLLFARRVDTLGWLILEDYKLPCVLEFKNASDDINYKILRGDYELSYMETSYFWTECLLDNKEYVEFQNICIEEMMFEDDNGELHLKYVITKEQFLKVTSWENNLEQILDDVEYALPNTSHYVGIFDTELEAYVYARKMYEEIGLMDKVKLKYICKYLIPEDKLKQIDL